MAHERLNVTRKALMWWFDAPATPYVTFNGAVDFTACRSYLATLNDGASDRVSIHHLAVAAVARTLGAFPAANARITGYRLERIDKVGVAMPVNLVGHHAGQRLETGLAVVDNAAAKSLRDVAASSRAGVGAERQGESSNRFVKQMYDVIDRLPYPVVARGMTLLDRASKFGPVARRLYAELPVTTLVTNVGSDVGGIEGGVFRGGFMAPPIRILHLGTVWGIAPVQDEVVAVAGVPAVRPMLPFTFIFDHRLVDGVQAASMFRHLAGLLQDPESTFGRAGEL